MATSAKSVGFEPADRLFSDMNNDCVKTAQQ